MMNENELTAKLVKEKNRYFLLASRPFTVQRMEIIGFFARNLLASSALTVPLSNGNDSFWLEKIAVKRSYRRQAETMLVPGIWEKQKKHYSRVRNRLKSVSLSVYKIKNNSQELLSFFEKWQSALDEYSYYFIAPFWVEEILFPRLQKLVSAADLAIISEPSRIFGYQYFQQELLAMGAHPDYDYLQKKYAWLTEYSLREKLLDRREIDRRRREIKNQCLESETLKTDAKIRSNRRDFIALKKRLSPELATLADLVHEYVTIRTERIEQYQQALVRVRHFYGLLAKLISKRFPGFNYLDAVSLTITEIRASLQQRADLPFKEIRLRARQKFAAIYSIKNKQTDFIYGNDNLKNLCSTFLLASAPETSVIKGSIVSKGKVRGLVRIIYRPSEFKKFRAGEILVSNYTSPSFMSVIKKAAALVTDEGGITSHAAIVSREFGKPCVTATRIATKVLKDGDLVEVDADKGIVRIIK